MRSTVAKISFQRSVVSFHFKCFISILRLSKYQMINNCEQNKKMCILCKCETLCVCCGRSCPNKSQLCLCRCARLELVTGSWAQASEPAGRKATRLVWNPPLENRCSSERLMKHSFICYRPFVMWRIWLIWTFQHSGRFQGSVWCSSSLFSGNKFKSEGSAFWSRCWTLVFLLHIAMVHMVQCSARDHDKVTLLERELVFLICSKLSYSECMKDERSGAFILIHLSPHFQSQNALSL